MHSQTEQDTEQRMPAHLIFTFGGMCKKCAKAEILIQKVTQTETNEGYPQFEVKISCKNRDNCKRCYKY